MMFRNTFIYLLVFLFLFLLPISVNAIEFYNYNPYFNKLNHGYYVADQFTNVSCAFGWWFCGNISYSCFDIKNSNNALELTSSNNCNWATSYVNGLLVVKMLSDESYYKMADGNYTNMISDSSSKWCDELNKSPFSSTSVCSNYDNMVLPANREGIMFIQYSLNDTSSLNPIYSNIEIFENGVTLLNSTTVSTFGALTNKTFYIPAKQYQRDITAFFELYYVSGETVAPTNLTIYKWKFYSLDNEEYLPQTSVAGENNSLVLYNCNATGLYTHGSYASQNTLFGAIYELPISSGLYGSISGQMNYNEDKIKCMVIKVNDTIYTRRVLSSSTTEEPTYHDSFTLDNTGASYFLARDLGYIGEIKSGGANWNITGAFYNQITPNELIYTCEDGVGANEIGSWIYNTTINFTNGYVFIRDLWLDCNSSATPYKHHYLLNTSSGSSYKVSNYASLSSSLLNIFSTQCAFGLRCSENQQYFMNEQCDFNVAGGSAQDCGLCGCSAMTTSSLGTGCNFPEHIGSLCNADGRTFTILYQNCTQKGDSCYPNFCKQINVANLTSNYILECVDSLNNPQYCYNSAGVNVSCSDPTIINLNGTAPIPADIYVTNPAGAVALLFGGLFGIKDLPTSQNLFAIIFSFLILPVVMLIIVVVASKGKIDSKSMVQLLTIVILGGLTLFTAISWLNIFFYVIIMIISVFIMIKYTTGIFGGG